MTSFWLVSCERIEGLDVGGRVEAANAGAAAKIYAERGGRGRTVIKDEQTGECTTWRLNAVTLFYAYPERTNG